MCIAGPDAPSAHGGGKKRGPGYFCNRNNLYPIFVRERQRFARKIHPGARRNRRGRAFYRFAISCFFCYLRPLAVSQVIQRLRDQQPALCPSSSDAFRSCAPAIDKWAPPPSFFHNDLHVHIALYCGADTDTGAPFYPPPSKLASTRCWYAGRGGLGHTTLRLCGHAVGKHDGAQPI